MWRLKTGSTGFAITASAQLLVKTDPTAPALDALAPLEAVRLGGSGSNAVRRERAVLRHKQQLKSDAQLATAAPDSVALRELGERFAAGACCNEMLAAACALYAQRNAFGDSGPDAADYRYVSYQQFWARVQALAAGAPRPLWAQRAIHCIGLHGCGAPSTAGACCGCSRQRLLAAVVQPCNFASLQQAARTGGRLGPVDDTSHQVCLVRLS